MQKSVLHLARRSAPDVGGVEAHLSHLIPELQKLGYHSTIFNERMLLGQENVIFSHKLAIWFRVARRLFAFLRSDIIHVHDVFWWLLPFLPVLWWKRIYITFHGYELIDGPSSKQKFWHQLAAKLTRGNLCIGGFHTKWYGVVSDEISYGAVLTTHKKSSRFTTKKAVFVGRLEPDTGFREYVAAIAIAKQNGQSVSLDVYGDGSERTWAEKVCKKQKLPVRFFGFVPNAGLLIGKYSHAFVSQYLAILESMSAGVLVIAYAQTGFKKDYLQLTPFAKWIHIATTPDEVVAALAADMRSPFAAEQWAQKQTWEKLARQYHELWSDR
ncbi:MAG: glycosyltransferase family 4 protein [bacterium]|nr:glycosyltransferase family 4 protein [bacterium]